MRVEFVNPFLVALIDVMTTMAKVEAKPSKPRLKQGSIARGEVTGFIAMKGEHASGSLAISFEKNFSGGYTKLWQFIKRYRWFHLFLIFG